MIQILDVRLLTLDIRDDWIFLKEIIIKILQSDNLCLNLPMYLKDVVNMATTAISPSTNQDIVSPLDALWSLYQSQSKRVRKAFRVRLLAEESAERERTRMMTYEQKMSDHPSLKSSAGWSLEFYYIFNLTLQYFANLFRCEHGNVLSMFDSIQNTIANPVG